MSHNISKRSDQSKMSIMDRFFERHGILRSWVLTAIEMPASTAHYAFNVRGLTTEECARIEAVFHAAGPKLRKFRFGNDSRADVKYLREEFGIQQNWLAEQIDIREEQMPSVLDRVAGFRPEEKAALEAALRDTAAVMAAFICPDHNHKKAA